jgi:hypothetical protein
VKLSVVAVCLASVAYAQPKPAPTRTEQIVLAAQSFLGSLTPPELAKAQHPFKPPKAATTDGKSEHYGAAVSSFAPTSDVPRPGVRLGSLNAAQRADALAVLSIALSGKGYQKVLDVMDADQALAASGPKYDAGSDFYFFAVLGTPGTKKPWMIELGGHHLALDLVMDGQRVSITPTLLGAQPTTFVRDGKTVRPLGRELDEALALVHALDAGQRKQATIDHAPDDLDLGATPPSAGLCASQMTKKQQGLLVALVTEWVGLLNDEQAAPRLAAVRANLDRTYFAWHVEPKGPVYLRITGPTLHIELVNPSAGGAGVQAGGVNDVHTIYRDPTDAYGVAAHE